MKKKDEEMTRGRKEGNGMKNGYCEIPNTKKYISKRKKKEERTRTMEEEQFLRK